MGLCRSERENWHSVCRGKITDLATTARMGSKIRAVMTSAAGRVKAVEAPRNGSPSLGYLSVRPRCITVAIPS